MRQTLHEHSRQLAHLILPGTVAELDAATACVRVEAGELLTGWLPVMAARAGVDRFMVAAAARRTSPRPVSQWRFSTGHRVTRQPVPDRFPIPGDTAHQACIVFGDATSVTYDRQAHTLTVDASASSGTVNLICATATLQASHHVILDTPQVQMTGDLSVNGTIQARGDITSAGIGLQSHHHTAQGPQAPTTPAQG